MYFIKKNNLLPHSILSRKLAILLIIFSLGSFYSCSDDSDPINDIGSTNDFDRQAMLAHWADNIIIPEFVAFNRQMENLKAEVAEFSSEQTGDNLSSLRDAWFNAYLQWQRVSMFSIGKAEEIALRENLNIYPTDISEIEENISSGDYNLVLPSLIDAQGFSALDYLLFGLGSSAGIRANEDDILAFYTTHINAANYLQYLNAVTERMSELTQSVLADWQGGFRDEFVNNSGSTATASVNRLVNDYIFYFEKALRAGKVGIPAGVFSGSPLPGHVEALYKGDISKPLLLASIDAVQDFFNGVSFNGSSNGPSLAQNLDFLNTIKNSTDLSTLINNQFDAARNQAENLSDNFSLQIETDNSQMLSTYDQLQLNVVLLKVDMLQALNISVDFVDADGD